MPSESEAYIVGIWDLVIGILNMALLIDDLLMLPVQGFMGIFEAIKTKVDEERCDEAKPQQELLEVQTLLDMGEITEQEYKKREDAVMKRLEAIRKYKEEQGGGQNG